ncbi:MAG: peptidoglycan-binding protein LysM [Gammaproteobacteria bacterium]
MSLFGFARDIGRRLFNGDEEAAEKIEELINQNNPGVKDLKVTYDDGLVALNGQCDSVEAMQKCVLMAGNVAGVKGVDGSALQIPRKAEAPDVDVDIEEAANENVEYYEIQSGDTLSKIAKRVYGDAMAYKKIFEANREVIEDPDKIFVGQKIRLPKD